MPKEMKRWMPMFWGDYLCDTAHLNAAEHGGYLLLIAHYWITGSIPHDSERLRRITRMTPRQWALSKNHVMSFFGDDGRHKRIDQELAYAIEKSKRLSANAKLRHSIGRATEDTPTPTPTKKDSKILEANGHGREGKRKPRHRQQSKQGRVWLDKGTEEFNQYAQDYFEKHGASVTLQWNNSGAWFNLNGEPEAKRGHP